MDEKPYFGLFKKAKQIINEQQIKLEDYRTTPQGEVYLFIVKDYKVTLTISKADNSPSSVWKRDFQCDCKASIRNTKEMCSHELATLVWLIQNA